MRGVFVRSTLREPFAQMIVDGVKTIETRTQDTLKSLVGQRVAVVRTGHNGPFVIGYVTIESCHECKCQADWDMAIAETRVVRWSKYTWTTSTKKKFMYVLTNPERCTPYRMPQNAVRHGRVWAEWDEEE